jgi:hypothetical protein
MISSHNSLSSSFGLPGSIYTSWDTFPSLSIRLALQLFRIQDLFFLDSPRRPTISTTPTHHPHHRLSLSIILSQLHLILQSNYQYPPIKMTQPALKVIKFPSIGRPPVVFPHIENVAQYVGLEKGKPFYNKSLPLPKLTFNGTVKLDGANCAIVKSRVDIKVLGVDYKYRQYYQSRQKVLTLENDFNGYAAHMENNQTIISKLFEKIVDSLILVKGMNQDEVHSLETIAIFGEWCGEKIQKHIALSQ